MLIGKTVCTKAITDLLRENKLNMNEIIIGLERFKLSDFGDVCKETAEYQNNILNSGDTTYPYMGIYKSQNNIFWIMNGIDEKIGLYTTIMLPSDY